MRVIPITSHKGETAQGSLKGPITVGRKAEGGALDVKETQRLIVDTCDSQLGTRWGLLGTLPEGSVHGSALLRRVEEGAPFL